MKIRYSLFLMVLGISLISAGLMTQVSGVVRANPVSGGNDRQPVVPPFTDTACLECHTNREQLQLLAVEKEVVESHSEGPG